MKIHFEYGGEEGIVAYDALHKDVMVSHPDTTMKRSLYQYLTQERNFSMPSFGDGEHRMVLRGKAVANEKRMEMALNSASSLLGIKVLWHHKGNVQAKYIREVADNEGDR